MTIGIEEKACMILEGLSCLLSDGQVDYECLRGEHKFVITRAGARFKVRLANISCCERAWTNCKR